MTSITARLRTIALLSIAALFMAGCSSTVRINHVQFVGSHNSYKQAMSAAHLAALQARNPAAAAALDYAHASLSEQLDLGLRKLELDVFYQPASSDFVVGHVQDIDMNSHCGTLTDCLRQVAAWSAAHPEHVPIWISFNTKDQAIEGLTTPAPFNARALALLDQTIEATVGDRLIRPAQTADNRWPKLSQARGKLLLILDEQGDKRAIYEQNWRARPLYLNVPPEHPAAGVMIINDPLANAGLIRSRVTAGYLVRTRADADTVEARSGDTQRRAAAFASGAQAVSTDYYRPDPRFGTGYSVELSPPVRCNPVNAPRRCAAELARWAN